MGVFQLEVRVLVLLMFLCDKCKICTGIFDDLGLKFGINLHSFAIYACNSLIMLDFGFVEL